jgi:hypothetical protein
MGKTLSKEPTETLSHGVNEHIIRDEHELQRVRRYILENPARWAEDRENPARLRTGCSSGVRGRNRRDLTS